MALRIDDTLSIPDEALSVRFTRAGGPGGQNVNKVSSRVELSVELVAIPVSPEVLDRLRALAGRRVSAAGVLTVACQESRDQSANREACLSRLRELVLAALVEPRERHRTRPSRAARQRRIESKKRRGAVKSRRTSRPAEDS